MFLLNESFVHLFRFNNVNVRNIVINNNDVPLKPINLLLFLFQFVQTNRRYNKNNRKTLQKNSEA